MEYLYVAYFIGFVLYGISILRNLAGMVGLKSIIVVLIATILWPIMFPLDVIIVVRRRLK